MVGRVEAAQERQGGGRVRAPPGEAERPELTVGEGRQSRGAGSPSSRQHQQGPGGVDGSRRQGRRTGHLQSVGHVDVVTPLDGGEQVGPHRPVYWLLWPDRITFVIDGSVVIVWLVPARSFCGWYQSVKALARIEVTWSPNGGRWAIAPTEYR